MTCDSLFLLPPDIFFIPSSLRQCCCALHITFPLHPGHGFQVQTMPPFTTSHENSLMPVRKGHATYSCRGSTLDRIVVCLANMTRTTVVLHLFNRPRSSTHELPSVCIYPASRETQVTIWECVGMFVSIQRSKKTENQ